MDASTVDMRYRTKLLMQAVDRNETVNIFHRGKLKAQLVPPQKAKKRPSVMDDPLCGYSKGETEPVADIVRRMRKPRYAI